MQTQLTQQQQLESFQRQLEEKRQYINQVLERSHQNLVQGDKNFEQFYFKEAHTIYISAIEGFIEIMKMTKDDANFQDYIKHRLNYTMDRTQMQNKHQAGYYSQNVNKDALNFIKSVLQERTEQPTNQEKKNEIIQKINDINKSEKKDINTGQADEKPPQIEEAQKKKSTVDPELLRQIEESILDSSPNIKWEDIQGLEDVKKVLKETIVLPTIRPDIFKGLLSPAKGILLYGPPGTGKTMLAKAIATECKCTFFSCSAVTLTSKWMGEGERLVRSLFTLAYEREPSVIFIDEIDSIMGARGGNEHEASRRLKTEFLVQFDGVNSNSDKKVLVLAATNRPQDLDEAALRRLTRRIYLPLPDGPARKSMIEKKFLALSQHSLSEEDIEKIVELSQGYSSADLVSVIKEVAMMPIREISTEKLMELKDLTEIRPVHLDDFTTALKIVSPSVSSHTIQEFDEWRREKGQI
ncbi:atpases of the aaa+ class [Stylonychia lemnae]|uniref:Atpases of the aaa+ class n=1 Tax=Stylonychia lemnae TaxID=5949 RepID=A0A078A2X1_STYLE|nr:atpases of the aaa+ class [Stylonychia lemnae]|eukprot:CDW76465.1 atpases of the aaa+ class [Stylonychia lemnae]